MQHSRLAGRYAKSLMDLAIEQNKLERLFEDMKGLDGLFRSSRELVTMLKSPVISAELKSKTLNTLLDKQVDELLLAFIRLVIQKGREFFLPEVVSAFLQAYKKYQRISEVTLTTAQPLDENMTRQLLDKIQQQFRDMKIELSTRVDDKLIGGFVLETENSLLDASILRELIDIKKQFLKNEYVPGLR